MFRGYRWLAAALLLAAVSGCGERSPSGARPTIVFPSSASPSASPSRSAAPSASPAVSPSKPAPLRFVFPVTGRASYARVHHDYPASDIMAPCGAHYVSPVDGVVLETNRVDRYNPKVNEGSTRGGLSVAIRGADGSRYYGSHFSSITAGLKPGDPVRAGQRVAIVGETGDASACHVHFGLSPTCAGHDGWWIRRGVIWPWKYLDAWRAGKVLSPAKELTGWRAQHGCPSKPLTP